MPIRTKHSALALLAAVVVACGGATAPSAASSSGDDGSSGSPIDDIQPDTLTCDPDRINCGSYCADPLGLEDCGQCGNKCAVGQGCDGKQCVGDVGALVFTRIFLGETDRTGAPSKDAWKTYGRDIDGVSSTRDSSQGECIPAAGASKSTREDGQAGIDNAFGKTIIPFLQPFAASPSQAATDGLKSGGRAPVLLVGSATTPTFALGFASLEPTVNPEQPRDFTFESVGAGGEPKIVFGGASLKNGVFDSGTAPLPLTFSFPMQGVDLTVPIVAAKITMNADGTNGTLSGVIPVDDFVTAMNRVAGQISTQLCGGSTLDAIDQTIRQAADIGKNGRQDATKTCDGISIGIGFETTPVRLSGKVAPPQPPSPDPCK